MPDPLVIVIPHTLGKAEALRRLQLGLTALAGNAPMFTVEQETWNGEELTFRVRALGDQKRAHTGECGPSIISWVTSAT